MSLCFPSAQLTNFRNSVGYDSISMFVEKTHLSNWWIATILKVKIEELVISMGGILLSRNSSDVNFIIVKNVLAAKYKVFCSKIAINIL